MKKIIFTSLVMLLASLFIPAYGADTFVAGFEDGETGYTINTGWADGYTWQIVENADAGSINNSDKCLEAQITAANPDRWGLWVLIKLDNPVLITAENRYVKIMAKRSPNNIRMALAIQGSNPLGPNTHFGQTKPSQAGVWGDLVFDLFNGLDDAKTSCENREIQEFMICLSLFDGGEPGLTWIDNIVLSDNSKPRGANELHPGLIVNFDDTDMTARNFASLETQSPQAFSEVVANPVKTDLNPTGMCLSYSKPANTTWWHASINIVKGIIPVEYPTSQLHVMMYIPDATPATIIIKSVSGEINETFYPEDGENWYDYIVDVSELDYITEINFRFNTEQEEDWDNPAGVYYVDDFALTADTNPRTTVTPPTSLNESLFEDLDIDTNGNIVTISSPDLKTVTVYAISGQLVGKQTASGSSVSFTLPRGIYIINADGNTRKIIIR